MFGFTSQTQCRGEKDISRVQQWEEPGVKGGWSWPRVSAERKEPIEKGSGDRGRSEEVGHSLGLGQEDGQGSAQGQAVALTFRSFPSKDWWQGGDQKAQAELQPQGF